MKITIPKAQFQSASSVAAYDAPLRSMGVSEALDDETLKDLTTGKLEFLGLGSTRREPTIRSYSVDLPPDTLDRLSDAVMPDVDIIDLKVYDIDKTGPYFLVARLANGTFAGSLYSKAKVK